MERLKQERDFLVLRNKLYGIQWCKAETADDNFDFVYDKQGKIKIIYFKTLPTDATVEFEGARWDDNRLPVGPIPTSIPAAKLVSTFHNNVKRNGLKRELPKQGLADCLYYAAYVCNSSMVQCPMAGLVCTDQFGGARENVKKQTEAVDAAPTESAFWYQNDKSKCWDTVSSKLEHSTVNLLGVWCDCKESSEFKLLTYQEVWQKELGSEELSNNSVKFRLSRGLPFWLGIRSSIRTHWDKHVGTM